MGANNLKCACQVKLTIVLTEAVKCHHGVSGSKITMYSFIYRRIRYWTTRLADLRQQSAVSGGSEQIDILMAFVWGRTVFQRIASAAGSILPGHGPPGPSR
jgi:hypothetical protein